MKQPNSAGTTRDLAITMISAAVMLVVLESQGLVVWASRLDTGLLQHVAEPVVHTVNQTLQPLGVSDFRQTALDQLETIGWSDQAAEAQAAPNPAPACAPTAMTTVQPLPTTLSSPALSVQLTDELPTLPRQTPLHAGLTQLGTQPRLSISLVGDSMMAVGLSAVLQQQYTVQDRVQFIRAYKSGTGLARPDSYDWQQRYPIVIGTQRPDVVVVSIGANDGQSFVQNGELITFGSAEWQVAYGERVLAFMQTLTQHGAQVIWVGLPPMKQAKFDQKIDQINRLTYSIVRQYPNSTWWNPAALLANPEGKFMEFDKTETGQTVRIRAADGIHLSNEGAARLAAPLMQWLAPVTTAPTTP